MLLKLLRSLPIIVLAAVFFSLAAAAADYPLSIEKGYHKLYLKNTQRAALTDLMLDSDLYLDSTFYEIPSSLSVLYSGSRAAAGLNALRYFNLLLNAPAWQLSVGDKRGLLSEATLKDLEFFGVEYKSHLRGLDYTIIAGKPRYLSGSTVSGGSYSYTHVFPRSVYGLRLGSALSQNISWGLNYSLAQDDKDVLNALSSGMLISSPLYSSILSLDTDITFIPKSLALTAEYAQGSFDSNLNDAAAASADSALTLKGYYQTKFLNLSADYSRVGANFRLPQDFKGKAAVLPTDREGGQANLTLSPWRMLSLDLNYRTYHNNLAEAAARSTQTYTSTGGRLNLGGQNIIPKLSVGYQQMGYGGPAAGGSYALQRTIYQRSIGVVENLGYLTLNGSVSQYDHVDETSRAANQQSMQNRGGASLNLPFLNTALSGSYVNTRYNQITSAWTTWESDSTQLFYNLYVGRAGLTPLFSLNRSHSITHYFTGTSNIHQNISTSVSLSIPLFAHRFGLASELGLLQNINSLQTIDNFLTSFNLSADYKSDAASQFTLRYKNSTFRNNLASASDFVDHSLEFKYAYYFGVPQLGLPRAEPGPRAVRGRVFDDKNGNQQYDNGEELGGVRLVLDRRGSALTNRAGEYIFVYLMPGKYEIELDPATVSARFAGVDLKKTVLLSEGGQALDFALKQNSVVKGSVFTDRNHNKQQDESEAGVPQVRIALLDPKGKEIETKTDIDGSYAFEVEPGRYLVAVKSVRFKPTTRDSYNIVVYPQDTVSNLDFGVSLNY